jgi:thiosulfate/3-mercaptopyruvate sulfurtransferase
MKKLFMAMFFVSATATSAFSAYSKGKVDVTAYPNADILISPEEAVKKIGAKNVMFVSGDSADNYLNKHIRGSAEMYAHHIHHSNIMGEMHCAPLYRCIEDAEKYIGHAGIDNDTLVIAYDDFKGPNATGVYSFFKSIGHKKVKVLMGGWKAIEKLDPNADKVNALKKKLKAHKKAAKKASKKLGAFALAEKRLKAAKFKNNTKKIAKYEKIVKKGPLPEDEKSKLDELIKSELALAKKITAEIRDLAAVVSVPRLSKDEAEAVRKEVASHYDTKLSDDELMEHVTHHRVAESMKHEGVTEKHFRINKKKLDYSAIASKEDVLHAVHDIKKRGKKSKYVIIDARGMTEIIGERKMDNVARGGHVPGSTFLEWKHVSDAKRGVAFRTKQELAKLFKKFGLRKNQIIYAYCHVGAGRSSEVITALEIMGYKHVKVYTGSWDEWGNDMMLPIKR